MGSQGVCGRMQAACSLPSACHAMWRQQNKHTLLLLHGSVIHEGGVCRAVVLVMI